MDDTRLIFRENKTVNHRFTETRRQTHEIQKSNVEPHETRE